jgi:hypothetical protein
VLQDGNVGGTVVTIAVTAALPQGRAESGTNVTHGDVELVTIELERRKSRFGASEADARVLRNVLKHFAKNLPGCLCNGTWHRKRRTLQ